MEPMIDTIATPNRLQHKTDGRDNRQRRPTAIEPTQA